MVLYSAWRRVFWWLVQSNIFRSFISASVLRQTINKAKTRNIVEKAKKIMSQNNEKHKVKSESAAKSFIWIAHCW